MNLQQVIRFLDLEEITDEIKDELHCITGKEVPAQYKWVNKKRNNIFTEEFLIEYSQGKKELSPLYLENNNIVN